MSVPVSSVTMALPELSVKPVLIDGLIVPRSVENVTMSPGIALPSLSTTVASNVVLDPVVMFRVIALDEVINFKYNVLPLVPLALAPSILDELLLEQATNNRVIIATINNESVLFISNLDISDNPFSSVAFHTSPTLGIQNPWGILYLFFRQ